MVFKTVALDEIGLPGFIFIRDDTQYYSRTQHTNMDLYDHVQEDDLKQAAIIMASFIYHAAMRDERCHENHCRANDAVLLISATP